MGQDGSSVQSKDGSQITLKLTKTNKGFYSPGDTITGELTINLKTSYYAKGISLSLYRTDRSIFEIEQWDRQ